MEDTAEFQVKAPINIHAVVVSPTRIDLTWQDNSQDEDGFIIERSAGGDFTEIQKVLTNTESYSDTGVAAGISYYYRMRAYNLHGLSDYSEVAMGSTPVSANHYIMAGASGNGTAWDNALSTLPDTLQRGHCYYIADGSYPAYTFNDATSGNLNIIIKKATISNHGTGTGWFDSYGDGAAEFQPLHFTSSYYIFDGQQSGGFVVTGGYQGHIIQILATSVIVRNCDLNGNFVYNGSTQTNGACTGVGIGDASPWYASFVTIENCDIHNIADDGFQIYDSENVYIRNNKVHDLYSCGTDASIDGPCDNGHSDSMEIVNLKDSEFTGNFIYNTQHATAALFFGDVAEYFGGYSFYCRNILLANNIFYMPAAGFVAYFNESDGIKAYNNIFWGNQDGRYGGISIWRVSNLDMYNNIILSIFYGHLGDTYDPSQHRGDYNLFGYSDSSEAGEYQFKPHDIVNPDPGFMNHQIVNGDAIAPVYGDFQPSADSPGINQGFSGDTDIVIPLLDYLGVTRPQGPAVDIGAFEYVD